MAKRYLLLEDGDILEGVGFGREKTVHGEVVFTTSMTGYPQCLTDPSYYGQILVFTYPLIGNYGIPKALYLSHHLMENQESERIYAAGVVVSSVTDEPSHFQSWSTFGNWMTSQSISGVSHIDTRSLTQKLRKKGTLWGIITSDKSYHGKMPKHVDYVSQVSLSQVINYEPEPLGYKKNGKKILLIDCGVKHGILRILLSLGYTVTRIPWDHDPRLYLEDSDGVICSNGPGNPKDCTQTIKNIQYILKHRVPFLGVCLGHQLLALALGADTYKLPYGHRGLNQPCRDLTTGRAYVTSQNHGYAVLRKTIPKEYSEWFTNLNDGTNEGLICEKHRVWSVQFHPEGNPGPFDTSWIFTLL